MSVIDERKIRYYTNPKKRIVAAVYRDDGYDIINFMNKKNLHILGLVGNIWGPDTLLEELQETKTYQAIAHCAEGDKYNEELGKLIAKTKLEWKVADERKRRLEHYFKAVGKAYQALANEAEKITKTNYLYIKNQLNYAAKKIKENCNG